MANRWGNSGNSGWLYFSGLQNHWRWWLQPWIKRCLLLGRKVMTNLDSMLKSRDITLPTKVRLVKAMVFPVFMYGCESWTVRMAECRRIDAFELWCWRKLLRVPWTARRYNQSILMISPEISYRERPWCWERLKAGGEWDDRDEMAGWHHWLDGCESEWTLGVGDGQGGLACHDSWGHRVGHNWAT